MTDCPAWNAEGLRSKATLYFDRAFTAEAEEDAELFAFWTHLGLEHLTRAAVAHVNPALLSLMGKPGSLLYGLGLDPDADPLGVVSAPAEAVVTLCEQLVPDFGSGEAAVCHAARRRRNAELHTANAAMQGLEPGWRGRVFATCKVLADHLGISFDELFGQDAAKLAEHLIEEDAESVRKTTRKAINDARSRAARLSSTARAEREQRAKDELREGLSPLGVLAHRRDPGKPRLLGRATCPGCESAVPLRGEVVHTSPPRVDSGELVQIDVALPTLLECPICELQLEGLSQLTQAGLGDPVHLRDYPDPVETFDVDLSDYRDTFLQSLAEDDAYQDE